MTARPPDPPPAIRSSVRRANTDPSRGIDANSSAGPSAFTFWVFDLDGTLIDVEPWYRSALLDRVGDRLDYRFSDPETDVIWYGQGERREQVLRAAGIDTDRFWRIFHDEEDPMERAEASYLYDDAEVVPDLPGPVSLVTHCQQYLTEPVLRTLDIHDWFDTVVCCTDDSGWKPAARPVTLAIAELAVDPSRSRGALVGDDPYDTGAAWDAGLESIHVQRYDPVARGHSVLGDWRISSLRGLLDFT